MINEFNAVFGNITVSQITIILLGVYAAIMMARRLYKFIISIYDEQRIKTEMIEKIQDELVSIQKKQSATTEQLSQISSRLEENEQKIMDIERQEAKRFINKQRDLLLRSYNFYTSITKNPQQAITSLEYNSFMEMFEDYEEAGGNGDFKHLVDTEFVKLQVIPMENTEKIIELMQSRG